MLKGKKALRTLACGRGELVALPRWMTVYTLYLQAGAVKVNEKRSVQSVKWEGSEHLRVLVQMSRTCVAFAYVAVLFVKVGSVDM